MTDSECGIVAAQWRMLDGIDLGALLINTNEAAAMMGLRPASFLKLVRDDRHPMAEFFAPAVWIAGPSGMKSMYQFWRHRMAVATHVYRRMTNDIGGPVGFDYPPDALAAARTYAPEVVRGALAALEAAARRAEGADDELEATG